MTFCLAITNSYLPREFECIQVRDVIAYTIMLSSTCGPGYEAIVPRPRPLTGRNDLVNKVKFLGLEAHYRMCNHCVNPMVPANVSAKAPVSTKHDYWLLISGKKMYYPFAAHLWPNLSILRCPPKLLPVFWQSF